MLTEAFGSVHVPEMPWAEIARSVRQRDGGSHRGHWWAASAAVLILLLAVGFASQTANGIPLAGLHPPGSLAPLPNCSVTFSIPGPTIMQPQAYVTVTGPGHPTQTFVERYSGSGYIGPCGWVLRLTEHPVNPRDVFAGWEISKRPGEFETVPGRPHSIRLTLRGAQVVYLKYRMQAAPSSVTLRRLTVPAAQGSAK